MKKLLTKSSFLILSLPFVYSCTSTKYIDNFVGLYRIDTGYQRKCHHYITKEEKVIEEKSLPYVGKFMRINKNGDVIIGDTLETTTITGKINTISEEKCNFKNLAIEDSFEFTKQIISKRNRLYHSYTSPKVGFDYDFTTRVYSIVEYFDLNDFKNVIGEYYIEISTYNYDWEYDGQHRSYPNSNYRNLKGGKVVIKEDKTLEIKNYSGETQTGNISFDNSKIYFNLNNEDPFILPNMKCVFKTEIGEYFYINGDIYIKTEGDKPTRYTEERYSISMRKDLPQ